MAFGAAKVHTTNDKWNLDQEENKNAYEYVLFGLLDPCASFGFLKDFSATVSSTLFM